MNYSHFSKYVQNMSIKIILNYKSYMGHCLTPLMESLANMQVEYIKPSVNHNPDLAECLHNCIPV